MPKPKLTIDEMHRRFTDVVETFDYVEIATITVTPDGKFSCPSADRGRIAIVSSKTRKDFAKYLRDLASQVEQFNPNAPIERRRRS